MQCFRIFFVAATMFLLSGCELMDSMNKPPKYVISFHEIIKYPRASEIERPITTLDNKKIYININQFVHSSDIADARLVEIPGTTDYFRIRLRMSSSGVARWHAMSINFRGREIAMMLDGVFLISMEAERFKDDEDEWVLLNGPFDAVTANGIVKNAPINYKIYNPDPNRIF